MKRIVTVMCAVALALAGLSAPASAGASTAGTTVALNCQHSEGDGQVRSADYLHLYSNYDVHIGAVQLCKDSLSRFWGYMVLYNPLPAGRWGNVFIEAYWNGEYQARYSCEGRNPPSVGNGHIRPGETMCWTPKLYGTDTRWTYYVYGFTCFGAYDDTRRCYAEGRTKFTHR